jgi:hypothetical protein
MIFPQLWAYFYNIKQGKASVPLLGAKNESGFIGQLNQFNWATNAVSLAHETAFIFPCVSFFILFLCRFRKKAYLCRIKNNKKEDNETDIQTICFNGHPDSLWHLGHAGTSNKNC